VVNGIPQDPIDGVSFAYTFDDPSAAGRLAGVEQAAGSRGRTLPTAAILAAGLAGLTVTGLSPFSATWLAYTSVAALMCEALLLLARVLKLGFIGDFLSASVLIGFLTGVGIQVLCGSSGRCWQSRPPASC